jgi:hypothetical protein
MYYQIQPRNYSINSLVCHVYIGYKSYPILYRIIQRNMIINQGELVVYNPCLLNMGIFINLISFHEIK